MTAGLKVRRGAKYFEVFYGNDLKGRPEATQDMVFRTVEATLHNMPHEALVLKDRIEDTLNRVTSVTRGHQRATFIEQIGGYARIGLEEGQFELAASGIASFRDEFARTVGMVLRGKYIKTMATIGSLVGFSALVIALFGPFILAYFTDETTVARPDVKDSIQLATSALFIVVGVCIGAVLSAFVRNRQIAFANIGYFDQDSFDPKLRYLFLGVLAAVLAILLYKNWIVVGVAKDLLLNHFNTDPTIAVILGLVTGYAEPNVTKMVTSGLEAAKVRR